VDSNNPTIPAQGTSHSPSPKEKFELARELIRHEDGLVNSRVTWLQVFQGVLFTAFFAGLGLFKEDKGLPKPAFSRQALVIALSLLAVLGIAASYAAYRATLSALDQISTVEAWWKKSGHKADFPRLTGHHGTKLFGLRVHGAHMLLAFAVAWGIFLLLFLYGILSGAFQGTAQ
jgi:hypothetical protein